jgi:phosphatidylinositol kinase/protein kinase (PI-3  family)
MRFYISHTFFYICLHCLHPYTPSCAAYSVFTYIFGVGDRHLDNLLLQPSGRLFHIDFGFIFGKDPKPLITPTIRFTKEMLDAMGEKEDSYRILYDGGDNNAQQPMAKDINMDNATDYRALFFHKLQEIYLKLRKEANFILSVVRVMFHAELSDLSHSQVRIYTKCI